MEQLTRFSKGSVRELFAISLPIFIALLSQCAMSFCDRCFLARYSINAFEGASIGGYLAFLFQASCIRLTSINQTFIAQDIGAKNTSRVAPYTWQMIWASFLTALLVIPIGLIANHYYFGDAPAEKLGSHYFLILLCGNSLFAMGATFAAFQAGIGETKILTQTALIANSANILLNYLLIFGVDGWIPPLGIAGAAWGTILSQGLHCLLLFLFFVRHKKGKEFSIKAWHFSPKLFLQLFRVGAPHAIRCAASLLYWVGAVKLISQRGGDFLLALSYGSTLWLPARAFVNALSDGALSIFSFFLGKKNLPLLWKSFRSALFLLFCVFLGLGVPLAMFAKPLIKAVISAELSSDSLYMLQLCSFWFWIYCLFLNLYCFAESLIVALQKTAFMLKFTLLTGWATLVLPYYLAFHFFSCSADKVWMVNWICCIFPTAIALRKIVSTLKQRALTAAESLQS